MVEVVEVVESEVKGGSNANCCVVDVDCCVVAADVDADVGAGAGCVAAGAAVGTMDVGCSGVLAPHPIFVSSFCT